MKKTVAFVSLGCDKNLVDSEVMLGLLDEGGYRITDDEQNAEVLIVNTCAFIKTAQEESVNAILEVADYKKEGNCKVLVVTGCLAERYREKIMEEIEEVDAVLGTGDYEAIIEAVEEAYKGQKSLKVNAINRDINESNSPRLLSTLGAYAYLKIAEGCDKHCTYCIIPKLRGNYRSRRLEALIEEAKRLAQNGVQELIIVAQDTTRYGIDLYGEKRLPQLLKELAKIQDIKWIRLMYCYPEEITDELINTISEEPKICNYIDMPIQHVNNTILRQMGRKSTKEEIVDLINKLREHIKNIVLRTSLIVGFPGETEEHIDELCDFLQEMKLDRAGVFTYSQEEGTPAFHMKNQVKEDIKIARQEKVMSLQQKISFEKNQDKKGMQMEVIVEGKLPEESIYTARSYGDAPEVDAAVFIATDETLLSGEFVEVVITDCYEYDLIGVITDEFSE